MRAGADAVRAPRHLDPTARVPRGGRRRRRRGRSPRPAGGREPVGAVAGARRARAAGGCRPVRTRGPPARAARARRRRCSTTPGRWSRSPATSCDWADRLRDGARRHRCAVGMIDVVGRGAPPRGDPRLPARATRCRPACSPSRRRRRCSTTSATGVLDLVVCVEPPERDRRGRHRARCSASRWWCSRRRARPIGRARARGGRGCCSRAARTPASGSRPELRALGAPVQVAAESHQPDVLLQMVRLGLGWTVLPGRRRRAGRRRRRSGRSCCAGELVLARRAAVGARPGRRRARRPAPPARRRPSQRGRNRHGVADADRAGVEHHGADAHQVVALADRRA